jgi:predicted nucleotidyltransferase
MSIATHPGLIPQETIDHAAQTLLEAAPQGSEVILFGSYARGDANPHSDLDFMVVEQNVTDSLGESVRLRRVLREVDASIDVLVVSRERFEAWKGGVNSVVARAHREGRRYAGA